MGGPNGVWGVQVFMIDWMEEMQVLGGGPTLGYGGSRWEMGVPMGYRGSQWEMEGPNGKWGPNGMWGANLGCGVSRST